MSTRSVANTLIVAMKPGAMQRRLIACAVVALVSAALLRGQAADAVYVATYLEVRPAAAREGAALMQQYAAATRRDAGNLRADALQEIGRASRFLLVAAWNSDASLAAHQKAAHTTGFRDKLKSLQAAPYDQRIHRGFTVDAMPLSAGANGIYVATHVDVPPPRREEAEMLLKRLVEPSRRDAGHVHYDVYQQSDRTNHFTVFAAWNGRAAFDAYGNTAHWLQFRETLGPMLGALYDERLYQAIRP